ncbi:MAG: hypothetical protein KGI83_07915, partial [Verrucomicrobiota bacterium]|nr:hypothetical protein [Verrucomicrobiota bacterium]
RLYLEENPPYTEWKYQIVTVRMDHADTAAIEEIYETLNASHTPPAKEGLQVFEKDGVSIAVSNELVIKSSDLADHHKAALEDLAFGGYSQPIFQQGRDKKAVYRIFYLLEKTDYPAPAFDTLSTQLKHKLVQEAMVSESDTYLKKLRRFYGFDDQQSVPEDLHPFSLQ